MTAREKLVELYYGATHPCRTGECRFCTYNECDDCTTEKLVDYLIAHGVVISKIETTTQRWIPVTERLPEPMEWVLCACRGSIIEVMRYHTKRGGWDPMSEDRLYIKSFVTHWMPLPALPEK